MNYASTLLSAFLRLVVYEKRKFSYYQWHSLFLAAAWKPELETKLSFAVTKKGENTCEKGENNMDRRKNIIPVLSCYAHDDGEDNESSEICIFHKKEKQYFCARSTPRTCIFSYWHICLSSQRHEMTRSEALWGTSAIFSWYNFLMSQLECELVLWSDVFVAYAVIFTSGPYLG